MTQNEQSQEDANDSSSSDPQLTTLSRRNSRTSTLSVSLAETKTPEMQVDGEKSVVVENSKALVAEDTAETSRLEKAHVPVDTLSIPSDTVTRPPKSATESSSISTSDSSTLCTTKSDTNLSKVSLPSRPLSSNASSGDVHIKIQTEDNITVEKFKFSKSEFSLSDKAKKIINITLLALASIMFLIIILFITGVFTKKKFHKAT